jgi:hypothetical protein
VGAFVGMLREDSYEREIPQLKHYQIFYTLLVVACMMTGRHVPEFGEDIVSGNRVVARHPKYGPAPDYVDLNQFRGAGKPEKGTKRPSSNINSLVMH